MSSSLPPYKSHLLTTCLNASTLKFGNFTLKSGRQSPYFFNTALFHRADLSRALSSAYAQTLVSSDPDFDVLFGPAYKGIPLASTTVERLAELAPDRFGAVSFAFNRKEAKDHGEGGLVVGAPLKGKRVMIIDDVVTAGTAKREAIDLIRAEGGTVVGIIVALDRQEKMPADTSKGESDEDGLPRMSAMGMLRKGLGAKVPVLSVLTLEDLIVELKDRGMEKELEACEEYRKKYRASD